MPRATIVHLPTDNPTALYHLPDGAAGPSPVFLTIDVDGAVTCEYIIDTGSLPASVYYGRARRYETPIMTTEYANRLLDDALPLAQRIVAGLVVDRDATNNHVGWLDDDANAAQDELITLIDSYSDADPIAKISVFSAAEWFLDGWDEAIDATKMTADSTDADISAMTEKIEQEVRRDCDQPTVVTGLTGYLTGLRDDLREQTRDRLGTVADQIDELKTERDYLIRQLHGWNTKQDSLRGIAARANLSHTRIDKIIKGGPGVDPDDTYIIQQRLADGSWDTEESFGSDLTAALAHRDARNTAVPDHQKSWKQYRIVDHDGRVYEYTNAEAS